jgi:hypothetical protein
MLLKTNGFAPGRQGARKAGRNDYSAIPSGFGQRFFKALLPMA